MDEGQVAEGAESTTAEAVEGAEGVKETPASQAPGAEGTVADDGKTYTGKDLARIVSERIAEEKKKLESPWQEFGDPQAVKARLARLEQIERTLGNGSQQGQGQQAKPAEETPQEKQFREYIESKWPGLRSLDQMNQYLQAIATRDVQAKAETGHAEIARLAGESLGIKDKNTLAMLNDQVAMSLSRSPEEQKRYFQTGDMEIVRKHFALVKTALLDPLKAQASAQYSETKDKTKKLAPQMPAGGAHAPLSKKEKLSEKELTDRAFGRFKELAAAEQD